MGTGSQWVRDQEQRGGGPGTIHPWAPVFAFSLKPADECKRYVGVSSGLNPGLLAAGISKAPSLNRGPSSSPTPDGGSESPGQRGERDANHCLRQPEAPGASDLSLGKVDLPLPQAQAAPAPCIRLRALLGTWRGWWGRRNRWTDRAVTEGQEWGSKMLIDSPTQKLIQTMRDEVNTCFSEIIHEVKQLQTKVLDFVEKEEATALGKLGSSIQQSHNRLLKLEGDSVWLHTLLTNRSDEQFLQARPHSAQALSRLQALHPQAHQTSDKVSSVWGCITLSMPLSQGAPGHHPEHTPTLSASCCSARLSLTLPFLP